MPAFDVYVEVRLMMRYTVEGVDDQFDAEEKAEGWFNRGIKGEVVERELLGVNGEVAVAYNEQEDAEEKTQCDPWEEDD